MIAEHTKLLNQERRKVAANVQSVTDKMNRLTNRKSSLQRPYLVNEYGCSSDKGEKAVTFNNTKNSNHSTSRNTSTSSEGKSKTQHATLISKANNNNM